MHRSAAFFFPTTRWGNEVGSQVAAYPKLACEAFRCDAYQALLFFDLAGCLDPRNVDSTACFFRMLRFLGFFAPLPFVRSEGGMP